MSYPSSGEAWMWMVPRGQGRILFAGVSATPEIVAYNQGDPEPAPHPFAFGSESMHTLVVGRVTVEPYMAVGTDQFGGWRIDQVLASGVQANVKSMLENGAQRIVLP